MVVIGLVLLAAAAALGLDISLENNSSTGMTLFGHSYTTTSGWVFVAGAVAGAAAVIGLSMLLGGMSRARQRRAALAHTAGQASKLAEERDRLAAELEDERAQHLADTRRAVDRRADAPDVRRNPIRRQQVAGHSH
jgi:signal transduction histidine kinase